MGKENKTKVRERQRRFRLRQKEGNKRNAAFMAYVRKHFTWVVAAFDNNQKTVSITKKLGIYNYTRSSFPKLFCVKAKYISIFLTES